LSDYELLELLLFRALPRRDVKPLAKTLLAKFGSFAEVIAAPESRLAEVKGLGDAGITELKIVQAAARRLLRGALKKRPVLSSWSSVLDYCRTAQGFADREQFRVLFLDKRNALIADEVQQTGTVDHTPVYPREVVKRARIIGECDHPGTQSSHSVFSSHTRSRSITLIHVDFLELQGASCNTQCERMVAVTAPSCRPQLLGIDNEQFDERHHSPRHEGRRAIPQTANAR
jgi:hypothetical protein